MRFRYPFRKQEFVDACPNLKSSLDSDTRHQIGGNMRAAVYRLVLRSWKVRLSIWFGEHFRRGSRSIRGAWVLFSTLSILLTGALPASAQRVDTTETTSAALTFQ